MHGNAWYGTMYGMVQYFQLAQASAALEWPYCYLKLLSKFFLQ